MPLDKSKLNKIATEIKQLQKKKGYYYEKWKQGYIRMLQQKE